MLRVLIAEDSATTRELLTTLLQSDAEMHVVGAAKNGVEAVAMTHKLRPDVVTMDIRMPLMDGFEATKRIMVEVPTPIVIVSASVDVREVEVSMHALRVGALTVLPKPSPGQPDFDDVRAHFLSTVKAMARVRVVRRWPEPSTSEPALVARPERGSLSSPRVVALAASTGGPAALSQILAELPGNFAVPILIVQHIAHGFVAGFASWLNSSVGLRAKVAESGERLAARTIYIAPDDRHLGVSSSGMVLISSAEPIGGFRPSASFLFESVANVFGRAALGVVLTGMGQDGLEGLRTLHRSGGQIFAQDESSSIVFGMPGAVVAAGLADATLPLPDVAGRIMRAVRGDEERP
jgi:two-component system, chemotaxis family, protein-glutamate methylesterase/glutaminase